MPSNLKNALTMLGFCAAIGAVVGLAGAWVFASMANMGVR